MAFYGFGAIITPFGGLGWHRTEARSVTPNCVLCRGGRSESELRSGSLWIAQGALIVAYTVLGVPYYNYSIMGPKTLF